MTLHHDIAGICGDIEYTELDPGKGADMVIDLISRALTSDTFLTTLIVTASQTEHPWLNAQDDTPTILHTDLIQSYRVGMIAALNEAIGND